MIENEHQLGITKKMLAEFEDALQKTEVLTEIDPLLKKIYLDAIKSQIETLKQEVGVYEATLKYRSKDGCPFKYCDNENICNEQNKCRYA